MGLSLRPSFRGVLRASVAVGVMSLATAEHALAAEAVASAPGIAAPTEVDTIVVTGSHLATAVSEAVPVNSYSAATIARSGQTNITDFLNTLPEVSVGSTGNAVTAAGGQTTVRLRGLPAGSTLVLINGRRIASSAVQGASAVFDLNAISADLIDRVDIVPTGSSAIYGSDAIGGVVNIVLKPRADGVSGSISQSFSDGYYKYQAYVGLGKVFSRGSISLTASYRQQDNLRERDRASTSTGNYSQFSALGGADMRLPYCDPGTVSAVSGNLNGVGANTAAIPTSGSSPKFSQADFISTAGKTNVCHLYGAFNVIPEIKGPSGLLSANFEISNNVDIYTEVFYSKYDTYNTYIGLPAASIAVPASNAFNPFGQAVRVTALFPVLNGSHEASKVSRPLVGIKGRLGGEWSWDAAVWKDTIVDKNSQSQQNTPNLTAALASSDPSVAIDPFRPSSNSVALIEKIFPLLTSDYRTSRTSGDAILRGKVLDLPAGPFAAAVGWEGGHEKVSTTTRSTVATTNTSGKRDTQSVFVETLVPILPSIVDGAPLLEADLAARYDHYSDFGGKTTPQAALVLHPLRDLSLHASYSKAFKAPTLLQLFAGKSAVTTGTLIDSKLGTTVIATNLRGGNAELQPETGKSTTMGAVWRNRNWRNLKLAGTYFHIEEQSRVVSVTAQTILDNESIFPGRVVRGTPAAGAAIGPVISVDTTYANFGTLKVSGFDLSASADFALMGGMLTPTVAVTRMLKYVSQIQPGQPLVDRLAQATASDVWAPRYKATVGFGWAKGSLNAGVQARYISRYLDYQTPINKNHLGNYWTFDGSIEIGIDRLPFTSVELTSGMYSRISASNLLDRGPKYSNFSSGRLGYDASVDDILGRTLTISVGKHF